MTAKTSTTLGELVQQIDDAEAQARRLVEGLSDEQLAWQPDPERWSIALCLEHLNIAGNHYLDVMEAAMAAAPRRSGAGAAEPSRPGWFERWFIKSLDPPAKVRLRAPKKIVPKLGSPPSALRDAFFQLQDRYRQALQTAEGVELNRITFASPLASLLKFRLGAGFEICTAHQRRHLLQAGKVKGEEGFPAS